MSDVSKYMPKMIGPVTIQASATAQTAASILNFAAASGSYDATTDTLTLTTAGGTAPTGSGSPHITAGVQDAAALPGLKEMGVCTLEQFGAVGDGATSDQAAYAAAIALMPATYKTILLGAKTYLVTGATLPAGCSIVGQGDASILKTTGTASVIVIGGDYCVLQNFKLLGVAAAAATQIGVRNGTAGSAGSGFCRLRISGVSALNFGGPGFLMQSTTGTADTIGPTITECTAEGCGSNVATPGAGFDIRAEYTNLVNCVARNNLGAGNAIGFWVYAGNVTILGGQSMLNGFGLQLDSGGNDAHGIVSGVEINHNNTGLQINAVANGHTFTGCHFYANQMWLVGCDGIRFFGCTISTDIVFQGSTNTRLVDCTFPNSGTINLFQSYLGNASTEEFVNCRGLDGSPLTAAAAHTDSNLVTHWHTGVIAVTPTAGATYTELVSNLVAKRIEYGAGAGQAQTLTYPTPGAARDYYERSILNTSGFAQTFKCGAGAQITIASTKTAILGFKSTNGGDVVRITADA